ncbi:MAG: TVP38/TMEM64 family protein [Deltaproteobacteria bacterium]
MTRPALLGLGALVLAGAPGLVLLLPAGHWAVELVRWIHGAGISGVAVFALAYIVATLAFFPGAILTAGAGFAYGPLFGTLLVSPVSVVAATVAFLLGRSVARGFVAKRLAKQPKFASVDRAIGGSGFTIVLLLRLSPVVPFNLLNYALGLTRVSLRDYVVASFLGMLPGTFLYVYLGSTVTSATELLSGKRPQAGGFGQLLYWGGLGATLLATVLISRVAKKALDQALATPTDASRTDGRP